MIDTDKYEGHTPAPWKTDGYSEQAIRVYWIQIPMADRLLALDAPLLLEEVKQLSAEVRRLRDIVCLLEDSRITNMSIHDRPQLFDDVAEVFRQRNEDTNGHLPDFEELVI
tara:strand:- start:21520 stop:21852 length:333 start_codon:yes stop_codon:yes gene_type:complete